MLYYHETLSVVPGKLDEYVSMLSKSMVALNRPRGREFIGLWRAETGNARAVLAMLVVEGWHKLEQAHGTPARSDPAMAEYRRIAGQWRQEYEVRLLEPAPFSPSLEVQSQRFFQSKLFLHEIATPLYGKEGEYYEALSRGLVPLYEKAGLKLYGVWRSFFRAREVIQMWAIADHATYARFRDSSDAEARAWSEKACAWRDGVTSQLLVPVPFER